MKTKLIMCFLIYCNDNGYRKNFFFPLSQKNQQKQIFTQNLSLLFSMMIVIYDLAVWQVEGCFTQYNQGDSQMSMREQPCPYRIIDDFGNGFSLGCTGGVVFYFLRGMWYAPKRQRVMGGIMLLKKRAPILGGNFAIWAGLFSATDCAMIALRKKQDAFNQIVAGAITGGLLAFRSGARVALKNGIFGGMMLGSIVIVEKVMMKMQKKEELQQQKQFMERQNREQRRQLAKMRPDLFEGSGDNLVPRVRRMV